MSESALSELCTLRTRPSSLKMDFIRIMTRSTCPTCTDWEARGKKGSPYTRASRVCLRSLGFRSNSSRMGKALKRSRRILLRMTGLSTDSGKGQDEPLSTLCTMQRTRTQEQLDNEIHRALLCLALKAVNRQYWILAPQHEPLQGGQRKRAPMLCPQNRQLSQSGGVG